jgi:hypothetical protein
MTPTSCYSSSSGSGSSGQRLVVVVAAGLLLHISISAAALSSGICFRLAGVPFLWGRLGMPWTPFLSPGAFVRQGKELRDILHIMCGKLLEHLLISHVLSKCDNNRSVRNAGDGVSNLGELLDEGLQ